MTRRFALVLLLILTGAAAFGGDIATFVNLGFSDDSNVFLFGQYGIDSASAEAFAEIYAVDVPRNQFVTNGVFDLTRSEPLPLGQDGRGALYALLGEAQAIVTAHGVDHLQTGRPVYILVDGLVPKAHLAFRDFNTNTRYDVTLSQEARGSGEEVSASFYIDLTLTYSDDSSRTVRIGRPGYFREGVRSYQITQILVSPDEGSAIFVVEKIRHDGSIRYMVETTITNR